MEAQEQIDKLDNHTRTEVIIEFCEMIKSAGYKTGVYLNPSRLENYVDKTQILNRYDLWLACYTYDPNKPCKFQYGQKMWQWGLEKIDCMDVDADICYYDYE